VLRVEVFIFLGLQEPLINSPLAVLGVDSGLFFYLVDAFVLVLQQGDLLDDLVVVGVEGAALLERRLQVLRLATPI